MMKQMRFIGTDRNLIVGRRWSLRAPAAGLLMLLVASGGSLKADNIAFMETSGSIFGAIDLNTGVFSLIGGTAVQLAGLGVSGATLYGLGITGNLYQVNVANGNLSLLGNSPHTYVAFGSTLTGLFGVDNAANVYSINPANGVATLLGASGVALTGVAIGISTNSSTLYWSDGPGLYTLNTSTGAATLVGNMGGPQLGAILLEGGILYGGENSPTAQVVTLNTTTGVATAGSLLAGATTLFGLAPDPLSSSTPEPGTWGLLAAGMIGMKVMRRRITGSHRR